MSYKPFYIITNNGSKYKCRYRSGVYGDILDPVTNTIHVVDENTGRSGIVLPKEVDWDATRKFNYDGMKLQRYIFKQKSGQVEVQAYDLKTAKEMAELITYKQGTSHKFYSYSIEDIK